MRFDIGKRHVKKLPYNRHFTFNSSIISQQRREVTPTAQEQTLVGPMRLPPYNVDSGWNYLWMVEDSTSFYGRDQEYGI